MLKQPIENYLSHILSRSKQLGFVEFHQQPQNFQANLILHRKEFVIGMFSMVDTFYVIMQAPINLDQIRFQTFGKQVFQFALENKNPWPRGLGGGAVAYPVLIADSVPENVRLFAESYCPKHWASFEFPVLVDLSERSIYYYPNTPAWGAFYYRMFQKEVMSLFGLDKEK